MRDQPPIDAPDVERVLAVGQFPGHLSVLQRAQADRAFLRRPFAHNLVPRSLPSEDKDGQGSDDQRVEPGLWRLLPGVHGGQGEAEVANGGPAAGLAAQDVPRVYVEEDDEDDDEREGDDGSKHDLAVEVVALSRF